MQFIKIITDHCSVWFFTVYGMETPNSVWLCNILFFVLWSCVNRFSILHLPLIWHHQWKMKGSSGVEWVSSENGRTLWFGVTQPPQQPFQTEQTKFPFLSASLTPLCTTLQSLMNAKLSQHRFWPCHENGLIKPIQTILHNQYVSFKVGFPLLWIRINKDKP